MLIPAFISIAKYACNGHLIEAQHLNYQNMYDNYELASGKKGKILLVVYFNVGQWLAWQKSIGVEELVLNHNVLHIYNHHVEGGTCMPTYYRGMKALSPGKPVLSGQLRATAIGNRTKNINALAETRTHFC